LIDKTAGVTILRSNILPEFFMSSSSRHRLVPLVALCIVLLLGACEGVRTPASLGRPGTGGPTPKETTPEGPPSSSIDPNDDPGHLRGMIARDVVAKLGDPNYRRRETPAEVWQYFGPGCVLDLFLYEDKGTQKVIHVELRSRNLTSAGQAACLAQLLEGKRGDVNS
jgi:hypothetical protein